MDLNNIIIGAIIVAVCIAPFILIGQSRKKRKKKSLELLTNVANKQSCNISKNEICGDFVIGIDETKKMVFFVKQLKDEIIEQYIDLAEIEKCKIKNTSRTLAYNNGNQNVIEKLELSFIPFDKSKKETTLEFFNTDISSPLIGELQSIEEWSKLINDYLKNKK